MIVHVELVAQATHVTLVIRIMLLGQIPYAEDVILPAKNVL